MIPNSGVNVGVMRRKTGETECSGVVKEEKKMRKDLGMKMSSPTFSLTG